MTNPIQAMNITAETQVEVKQIIYNPKSRPPTALFIDGEKVLTGRNVQFIEDVAEAVKTIKQAIAVNQKAAGMEAEAWLQIQRNHPTAFVIG